MPGEDITTKLDQITADVRDDTSECSETDEDIANEGTESDAEVEPDEAISLPPPVHSHTRAASPILQPVGLPDTQWKYVTPKSKSRPKIPRVPLPSPARGPTKRMTYQQLRLNL